MPFDLADDFAALIRKLSPGTLTAWLARAEASPCPELRRFAEGIRRDEAAVQAAVSERWSNSLRPPDLNSTSRSQTATRMPPDHSFLGASRMSRPSRFLRSSVTTHRASSGP